MQTLAPVSKKLSTISVFVVCVIILIGLGTVHGLFCYECIKVETDDVTLASMGFGPEDKCENKIPKNATRECPIRDNFCIKVTGKVSNGKHVELLRCGSSDYQILLGNKKCGSTARMKNFTFDVGSTKLDKNTGILCVCDTNKCNADKNFNSGIKIGNSAFFVLFLSGIAIFSSGLFN